MRKSKFNRDFATRYDRSHEPAAVVCTVPEGCPLDFLRGQKRRTTQKGDTFVVSYPQTFSSIHGLRRCPVLDRSRRSNRTASVTRVFRRSTVFPEPGGEGGGGWDD